GRCQGLLHAGTKKSPKDLSSGTLSSASRRRGRVLDHLGGDLDVLAADVDRAGVHSGPGKIGANRGAGVAIASVAGGRQAVRLDRARDGDHLWLLLSCVVESSIQRARWRAQAGTHKNAPPGRFRRGKVDGSTCSSGTPTGRRGSWTRRTSGRRRGSRSRRPRRRRGGPWRQAPSGRSHRGPA